MRDSSCFSRPSPVSANNSTQACARSDCSQKSLLNVCLMSRHNSRSKAWSPFGNSNRRLPKSAFARPALSRRLQPSEFAYGTKTSCVSRASIDVTSKWQHDALQIDGAIFAVSITDLNRVQLFRSKFQGDDRGDFRDRFRLGHTIFII
jgi:hypothetical protein